MEIVVIGANGQLGSDIFKVYKDKGNTMHALNHNNIDITEADSCMEVIKRIQPELLINTAAMHKVELCEQFPVKAFKVNGLGARNLAVISDELSIPLVHFSTDYVFDGGKQLPYVESDITLPINIYGNTKLSGEMFIRNIAKRYFIVRVSGLYGQSPCRGKGGLNFVKLMLKLAEEKKEIRVVDDEILSPTYTFDIAQQLVELTRTEKYGLYHMVSQGSCTWFEFAAQIFNLTKTNIKLNVARSGEFPTKVPRPKYSVLDNLNLANHGLDIMPDWSTSLQNYLNDYY
tara:strand:+ start:402 stop:1262 length:861 start_codon:yes stop_codon:yes gene_type:complete